jgi:hypothetical protein
MPMPALADESVILEIRFLKECLLMREVQSTDYERPIANHLIKSKPPAYFKNILVLSRLKNNKKLFYQKYF